MNKLSVYEKLKMFHAKVHILAFCYMSQEKEACLSNLTKFHSKLAAATIGAKNHQSFIAELYGAVNFMLTFAKERYDWDDRRMLHGEEFKRRMIIAWNKIDDSVQNMIDTSIQNMVSSKPVATNKIASSSLSSYDEAFEEYYDDHCCYCGCEFKHCVCDEEYDEE